MWVSRAGPGRNRGGERCVHVFSVVGPPLDRAFGLSLIVGEGERRGQGRGFEYASQAILYLYSALPVAIGVMLDNVWVDEDSRRAVCDGWARIVPV